MLRLELIGIGLAVVILSTGPAGAASSAPTVTWATKSAQTPSGTYTGFSFGNISCVSSSDCISTALATTAMANQALVEKWNGKSWSSMRLPSLGPDAGTGTACQSANQCWMMGTTIAAGRPTNSLILRWNGNAWESVAVPKLKVASALNNVACAGSTCWAVGIECASGTTCLSLTSTSTGPVRPLLETWNGKTWAVGSIPQPSGAYSSWLNAIHCPNAKDCIVVGNELTSAKGPSLPFAEQWNGSKWTVSSMPAPAKQTTALDALACPSATTCITGGFSEQDVYAGAAFPESLLEKWNGKSWTSITVPNRAEGSVDFTGISCTSTSRCLIVGWGGEPAIPATIAGLWNGSSFAWEPAPDKIGQPAETQLDGVACIDSTTCETLGESISKNVAHVLASQATISK